MNILENLYDKPPKISHFFGRKIQIRSPKTLLFGMPKSGISSIVLDFLSTIKKEKYLYIDLQDSRVDEIDSNKLSFFIEKNKILYLVIENFTPTFKLPNVQNIILTSHDNSLEVYDFEALHVKPLNFEEFIGFQQRSFNSEQIFNTFTTMGTLPKPYSLSDYENSKYLQDVLKKILNEELSYRLFLFIALHQSKPISFHKAYRHLKQEIKVSKDKLYKVATNFARQGLVTYLPKYNSPKSAKKVFLSDFAFRSALSYQKDFQGLFENMVFCELEQEKIFYTDELHFFMPKEHLAILCIPFLPPELILRRFEKLLSTLHGLHVKTLHVVTIGNEGREVKEGIICEIIPFWEWALML